MKTFQIRITKEGKHRCLKFKSELPMESVLAAVKAVVKDTYHVSIKEIHWRVPEDRDIMWAIKEAKAVRFYAKVWKINCHKVPTVIQLGQISLPHGTKIESNSSESVTFFNIITPYDIELDLIKIREEEPGLVIHTTLNGNHKYYIRDVCEISCNDGDKGTLITFYKSGYTIKREYEYVTEEL